MRGKLSIINSAQDAQQAGIARDQALTFATITVRHDRAVYPDGYDTSLKDGDQGYIEPLWEEKTVIDQAVMKRFGF
ncbi:hypothetical protein [Vibrio cholerae]|uniref:hypothetical protein n=1 Tax=Vibrio cholerae TaxID=666 RepID=UPI0004E3B587|nr:hypothetical protein [Vibrio cholerae]EGR1087892.1 hypothetical protein [Vibrio cholerae]KFE25059.1 hypothetical protein DA89_223 [Vibrio cholerae]TXZ35076.1 hypothetical protein FXE66_05825 [Vibrio cholerae]BCK29996.1 hypothetical protein VCSRO77_3415 [Vibrio cholerae]